MHSQAFCLDKEDVPWIFEKPHMAHLDPVDLNKYDIPDHLLVPNPKNSRGDDSQKGSTMDDLSVKVSPIPKRSATFEVTTEEADRISRYLITALARDNNKEIRHIMAGFKAIAEQREFGGH